MVTIDTTEIMEQHEAGALVRDNILETELRTVEKGPELAARGRSGRRVNHGWGLEVAI